MKHNFKYMLKDYGLPYTLIARTEDDYVRGEVIKGQEVKMQRRGIILTLSREELQYGTDGTYTTKDVKLFESIDIETDSLIEWQGDFYLVKEKDPWKHYSDFHVYICKKTKRVEP